MKPALYHAIRRGIAGTFEVVTVTTVQGNRWYGRTLEAEPTSGAIRGSLYYQLYGQYKTVDEAAAKVNEIRQIAKLHAPSIEAAEQSLQKAQRAKRDDIEKALAA